MQSTRWSILEILKRKSRATVEDLATSLGLTPTGVRQHVTLLERDGLVTSSEERLRLGRPRLVYHLTEKGEELFPRSYHLLTSWIMDEIVAIDGEEKLILLLDRIAERLAQQYGERITGETLEAKVESLVEILNGEGALAEWEKLPQGYALREYNCRFHRVALGHPQLCHLERLFLSKLLHSPVQMSECLLESGPRCNYLIEASTLQPVQS